MSRHPSSALAHSLIKVSAAFMIAAPAAATEASFSAASPAGFEDLSGERQLVVDAFFGGRKLGQVLATVSPGRLRFEDPVGLAKLLPELVSADAAILALTDPLATNSPLVCRRTSPTGCGELAPETVGIIFDEDRFRVDIFLGPAMLSRPTIGATRYLEEPEPSPAMISRFGATVSGSNRGKRSLHVQNRSIGSLGAFRILSDSSFATGAGMSFDNLTAQLDTRDRRYLGGVLWIPGSELAGRRKILGFGAMTQLDTRIDRTTIAATPLSIFLQQPARVDVLVDGKIVSSRIYTAGHRLIDTAPLPGGSYDVELRIQEDGRPARSEQRFFSRGSALAPAGLPQLSAFAGFLQTSPTTVSVGPGSFFYQATAAYRLNSQFGVDGTLLGSSDRALLEAGATWVTRFASVRALGLTSSKGDVGAALRASSYGRSSLSVSFDLRGVKSRDGKPLLPVSESGQTFSDHLAQGLGSRGTYLQGVAVVDYRFKQAALRLSGLYRRNSSERSTYNVAASFEVPLVRQALWDIRLQADVRKSREDVSSFLGFRFLLTGGAAALSGTSGISHRSNKSRHSTEFVGETQTGWQRRLGAGSELTTDFAIGRTTDSTYARGSGLVRSPWVNMRADLLHQFDGQNATQFAATADAAIVIAGGQVVLGARDPGDAAAIAIVSGAEPGQEFDVLVDEVVRGTVRVGHPLPVFLTPYAKYDLRLRPRDSAVHGLGVTPRPATLYPGNVARLDWSVTPLVVIFGRVLSFEGIPIANADIRGPHGISQTDDKGYFQIEAVQDDARPLEVRRGAGPTCKVALATARPRDGYLSIGDVKCS